MVRRIGEKPTQAELESVGETQAKAKIRRGEKNSLGISRSIYALGESAKDGLIVAAVASAAFLAVFKFGENYKLVDQLKKWVYRIEYHSKAYPLQLWNKTFKQTIPIKPPEDYREKTPFAAAMAFGWLVSHIGQLPGLRKGYKKVDNAIKKYDAVIAENTNLKEKLAACEELPAAGAQEERQLLKTERLNNPVVKSWQRVTAERLAQAHNKPIR